MATQIPELIPVPIVDPVSIQINVSIDRLIRSLEQRRHQLLTDLRDRREEIRANRVARQQIEQQITETRAFLEGQMTHNLLHSFQGKMVTDLEAKMAETQVAAPPQEVSYLCDTRDLEERISRLGQILQLETPPIPPRLAIPNYATFQQPIVAVGKEGSAPGEFKWPRGVSIDTKFGHIYVADSDNKRIQIFSETGEYINEIGQQHLKWPWGILLHQDSIFVTDIGLDAIFLYKLPDLTMVKRVGKKGSGNKEFNCPRQLAISPNQRLYVPDTLNNRIQILSTDLAFQDSFRHLTMTKPVDVKFTKNELFVLSREDKPCIHVFTLSGEKSRSLVTGGIGMQVDHPLFFCLDKRNNIVISNNHQHDIKVFSPAGDLLHTIGGHGHEAGLFDTPTGLAINNNNNKLVCVSENTKFGLQIFSA